MNTKLCSLFIVVMLLLAGCTSSGGFSDDMSGSESIGLAAGGAQDVNNFRENVNNGYTPQPTDLTYEGLFHDYYFDTGQSEACNEQFCPSYSRAVSRDPLSGEPEQYMTVGLNSGISSAEFERKNLNLVIVVDTSGSMNSQFRQYHYDDENASEDGAENERVQKMEAAKSALLTLSDQLDEDDRLAIVEYNDDAKVIHEMQRVGETDDAEFESKVESLNTGGGTNLDAGMRTAELLIEPYEGADEEVYENRIIYLTDAMPNLGDTSTSGLGDRLDEQAERGVYTTFIGVGIDFNSQLVNTITSVRGANYYAVGSEQGFEERMGEEFEYMVTPLVYNLSLTMDSDAYKIEQVYGSPEADEATGELMHVNTLFPSKKEDGKTEGGIVLLKLKQTGDGDTATLRATYETRDGEQHETTREVTFDDREADYYETTGIRKAITLSRYADLMRNWAAYERAQVNGGTPDEPADGIEPQQELGTWEQQSVDLQVSQVYRDRIKTFTEYYAAERTALEDNTMRQEQVILETLQEYNADGED